MKIKKRNNCKLQSALKKEYHVYLFFNLKGACFMNEAYRKKRMANTENIIKKVNQRKEKLENGVVKIDVSRVFDYVQDKTTCFGIVSAYNSSCNEEENKDRYLKLRTIVKVKLNYGCIELRGGFVDRGGNYNKVNSVFIPRIKKRKLIKVARDFNQEIALFKGGNRIYIFNSDKEEEKSYNIGETLNGFKEAMEYYYSCIFNFTGNLRVQEKKDYNHIERMGLIPFWFDIIDDSKLDLLNYEIGKY